MAAPCCWTKVRRGLPLALCAFVILLSVVPVSSLRHSSSSHRNRGRLVHYEFPDTYDSKPHSGLSRQQSRQSASRWETLLRDDPNTAVFPGFSDSASRVWEEHLRLRESSKVRRKRQVTEQTVQHSVPESSTGQLVDLVQKLGDSTARTFELISVTPAAYQAMFEVTTLGKLNLKSGYRLDYDKDASMRKITFIVDATSQTTPSDVTRVRAELTVTNVDEAPEFITEPQPYRATIGENVGSDYEIIRLVARDPEGQTVQYEKFSVQPSSISNRIALRTQADGGDVVCRILTQGSGSFQADEFRITVKARDSLNTGLDVTTTVYVKVGVLPPQFYQEEYLGFVYEGNQKGQSVYKQGTSSQELQIQTKKFQNGAVTMSLETEGGGISDLFVINSGGYIICNQNVKLKAESFDVGVLQILDYETINPKIQTVFIKATQTTSSGILVSQATLQVEIRDKNDHSPTFDKSTYLKTLDEDVVIGTFVTNVTARDADTGDNAQVTYSLLQTMPDAKYFEIRTVAASSSVSVGFITVKEHLDHDRKEGPYYNFEVAATDLGNPAKSSTTSVRVTVENVNDEKPQFIVTDDKDITVMETAPVGKYVTQVQARDKDGDVVSYRITSIAPAASNGIFNIDASTGVITLAREIRTTDDVINVTIMAQDDASCCKYFQNGSCCKPFQTLSNTTEITVQVSGVNQNKPHFDQCNTYNPEVNEHQEVGFTVLTVSASDPDRGPNGKVTYTIIPDGNFTIGRSSGIITVGRDIDRETLTDPNQQVTINATDGGNPSLAAYCTFSVTILDINDHSPVFIEPTYSATISVALQPKVPFLTILARDNDVGRNARVSYSLLDDAEGKFDIIPENGFISLMHQLTETDVTYTLLAMAKDNGDVPRNATVQISVSVKTINISPPTWGEDYSKLVVSGGLDTKECLKAAGFHCTLQSYGTLRMPFDISIMLCSECANRLQVNESVPTGTVIVENMTCASNIENPSVEFQLIDKDGSPTSYTDYFYITKRININRITVYATGKFDFYLQPVIQLKIRCLNLGEYTLMTETRPTVRLTDTNNKIPEFVGMVKGRIQASVKEQAPIGTSVVTVVARDLDATDLYSRLNFSVGDGHENFIIDSNTGQRNTFIIRTNREFDRELKTFHFISITAVDGAPSVLPSFYPGPNTVTQLVKIDITDINDNPPFFTQNLYHVRVNESFHVDQNIEPPITAGDRDSSDTGRHKYRILSGNSNPPAFGVRSQGYLFLIRSLDYEKADKNFNLLLEASDGNFTATATVTVTVLDVNDNRPLFKPQSYTVSNIVENDANPQNPILTVIATDADRDSDIRYRLKSSSFNVSKYFRLDERSGELSLISPLDRDRPNGFADYQMTVEATDAPVNPNIGYASVSVQPLDVNDNKPFFLDEPLVGAVRENSPRGSSVVLIRTEDYDYGVNGTVVMAITSIVDKKGTNRTGYFTINNKDTLITSTDGNNLDRETEDTYYVTIQLSDQGNPPKTTTGNLTVTLTDDNDQPPTFQQKIYSVKMSENLKSGQVISVVATDDDLGDNAKITYELPNEKDREFFKVENVNEECSIQVYAEVDYENSEQRSFNLTVLAKDNAGYQDQCYVYIEVLDFNDNAPNITPKLANISVSEDASKGTPLYQFSAVDLDSGINQQFLFSISRASDPLRQFFIDPVTGQVKTRRELDRETVALHELVILAIDKGDPAQTGTATLSVKVLDINDNYPKFKKDYHPHVLENEKLDVSRVVQIVLADDPDDPPYDIPYGFALTTCPGNKCPCSVKPTCEDIFSFRFDTSGADGNGSAIISTDREFDREQQKYYEIPVVMWDMRGKGSDKAMTGTNTLTVTIADINDNPMSPGVQDIFVYNYKGMFGPLEVGRVFAPDLDDWDVNHKTYIFKEPAWMDAYFKMNNDTGMVIMEKGVPSNTAQNPYVFQVEVVDSLRNERVISTVSVVIHELSEEAVRNSGAVRLKDMSAEEFIKESKQGVSKSDILQEKLATELGVDVSNVQIISVQDVEGGYVDVRYSAHGSPYYPPSQTDSIVYRNKGSFERAMGTTLSVPIDACSEEVFEGGCYNYMNITGRPAMVNSNGTSFVGVEVFIQAKEGCRSLDFPEPQECSGDYCYHGGTCVKDDFGVLSCRNCPEGFEGPRCQQLRHSFKRNEYATYATLEQCEDSETSIEFLTMQNDGLLLYNGPLQSLQPGEPRDFLALALNGGQPTLHIDHGSGSTSLSVPSSTLSDGMWHKINIIRKGKAVEMIVDDCKAAGLTGTSPPDTTVCRAEATTPGENSFLNVGGLLHVGGRPASAAYPSSNVIKPTGFNGCVKNLIHNSKIYDLYFKDTSKNIPSGENGCSEENCDNNECGVNGICTGSMIPPQPVTCTCKPGWRGDTCDTVTTVRDLQASSYIQWKLKTGVTIPSYQLEMQIMYRTYESEGVLFTVSSGDKRVELKLKDGHLQAFYDLGNGGRTLQLNKVNASNGQWHVAHFKRVMYQATLTLDGGEGANRVSQRTDYSDSVYMSVDVDSSMYGGAIVTISNDVEYIGSDLKYTCIQDVRLDSKWVPMKSGENSGSKVADFHKEKNVKDSCTRPDGCVPPTYCPVNTVCVDLWGWHKCKCASGYHETDSMCESDCLPDNPCFHDADCEIDNGTLTCDCAPFPYWIGPLCNVYHKDSEAEPTLGISGGTVAVIIVAIIVAILLLVLAAVLITMYNKRKSDGSEKFVVEDDADFDIRENVMFYDEEGAGEEDQNAYDLAMLPNPVSDPIKPPDHVDEVRRTNAAPLGKSVPDVGDVLNDRMGDADDDPSAPPYDTLIAFNDEGTGSDAGSLSSLGSSSSDASQDYDYLNDWGPKFAKLADMYGAGQDE